MAKDLARNCPRCAGYLGIVLREPGRNTPAHAVNGHCLGVDTPETMHPKKLLIEKGIITQQEFLQKISEERATYQKLLNPVAQ
jgi:hypothetical protein